MDGQLGLANGSRVGIIGGGISGSATAAALLFTARARGLSLDLRVFHGPDEEPRHHAPVLLSPECRSRLAALGCRIPSEWRTVEIHGIEIVSGRNRSLLGVQRGGMWIVDGWPHGTGGRGIIARALAQVAGLHGAKYVPRTVTRVETAGRRPEDPAPQTGAGSLVIWANGAGERVHSAVLASGVQSSASERFFEGFSGAPTVNAAEARLTWGPFVKTAWPVARLIVSPLPGVDALYLIPARSSVYALAVGEAATPADLCQALMMAARDGHLEEGFEIAHLGATRVPAGAGRRLCANGQLAVGAVAVGHPLQLTLSESLANASRAAIALVEGASDRKHLERRYEKEGIFDLAEDAQTATRALRWMVRAGDNAAMAVAKAQERAGVEGAPGLGAGILGLSAPSSLAVIARSRWAWMSRLVGKAWRSAVQPLAPAVPVLEPELYYVVDDDPDMRESVASLLSSRGAEVVSFGSELALFSAVARRRPSAIVLDVVLSWVDGLRLCEELKKHPLTRDSRVIVMSGLNRPYIRERALRAGAEAFLAKPVTPEKLLSALDPQVHHQAAWSRPTVQVRPRMGALIESEGRAL